MFVMARTAESTFGGALGATALGAVGGVKALGMASRSLEGVQGTGVLARAARRVGGVGAQTAHLTRNMTFDPRNLPGGSKLGLGAGTKTTSATMSTSSEQLKADWDANTPTGRRKIEMEERNKKEAVRNARDAARTTAGIDESARQSAESVAATTTDGRRKAAAKINQVAIDKRVREAKQKASLDDIVATPAIAAVGIPGTTGHIPEVPAVYASEGLKTELRKLESEYSGLVAKNSNTPLKDVFEKAQAAFEKAEVDKDGAPKNPGYKTAFIDTRNKMRKAEKELKDFKEGAEKIEKLQEKIEHHKAL